ncbi:uncharacterized protein LOC123550421 [Mercenaria mercenaria]|uniref:uncharacterized protein LOC123550421 n=1 Tax=Mercenaria mercenaria TaxID=6596 RepID=UPI00234F9E40|nr:uncharacterized protein LOC123550421 [Mercenaria mercenaria]
MEEAADLANKLEEVSRASIPPTIVSDTFIIFNSRTLIEVNFSLSLIGFLLNMMTIITIVTTVGVEMKTSTKLIISLAFSDMFIALSHIIMRFVDYTSQWTLWLYIQNYGQSYSLIKFPSQQTDGDMWNKPGKGDQDLQENNTDFISNNVDALITNNDLFSGGKLSNSTFVAHDFRQTEVDQSVFINVLSCLLIIPNITCLLKIIENRVTRGVDLTAGNGTTNILQSLLGNVLESLPGNLLESVLVDLFPNATDLDDIDEEQLITLLAGIALQAGGVSENCRNDIVIIFTKLMEQTDWVLQMVDAMGKPESGLLEGNLKWLGDYQECVNIKAVTDGVERFTGKYCKTGIPLGGILPPELAALGSNLEVGTCMPNSCSANDIVNLMVSVQKLLLNGTTLFQPEVNCVEDKSLSTDLVVCIGLIAMLLAAIIIGTLYDIFAVQMNAVDGNGKNAVETTGRLSRQLSGKISLYKPTHTQVCLPNAYINGGYMNQGDEEEIKVNGETKAVDMEPETDKSVVTLPQKENRAISEPYQKRKGTAESILMAFSFYSNGVKILNTDQAAGSLGAINGIRFLSMAWVILGHTYFFCQGYDSNFIFHFFSSLQNWTFMAISYATVSVDSFFAISGILVAYLTLKELKKVGGASKLNWFMFYFHRFWRLTPSYMLVLMVGTVILPYILNGPMWTEDDLPYMKTCRTNWWTNLLYVNNYVNTDEICMGWTWYLANDMQFYIISPLILLPLFYNQIAGAVSCLLFLTATTVAAGVVAYSHRYQVQMYLPYAPQPNDADYGKNLYMPSYARFGPYVVGLFTGYILYRCKCKCNLPKIINIVCWLISLALCCVCAYTPYSDGDKHTFTQQESAAFFALHRTAWGVAVCWIVFACATGHGGWINEVLSWKAFVPLGRLTYSAYLIHPLVMLVFYMSRNTPTYFSIYEVIYLFLGHLVLSYGIGFIVSLVFESPMMGLEKAIFKRGRK